MLETDCWTWMFHHSGRRKWQPVLVGHSGIGNGRAGGCWRVRCKGGIKDHSEHLGLSSWRDGHLLEWEKLGEAMVWWRGHEKFCSGPYVTEQTSTWGCLADSKWDISLGLCAVATWWNRRGVTRVPATLVWVEFSESSLFTFPGLLPDTPAPSGLSIVVASYLVELAGPCRKACIMGPQAMVSLGSFLKCIFLEQKGRASWDNILTHEWGWRVLFFFFPMYHF